MFSLGLILETTMKLAHISLSMVNDLQSYVPCDYNLILHKSQFEKKKSIGLSKHVTLFYNTLLKVDSNGKWLSED